jgi:hypothetical protein
MNNRELRRMAELDGVQNTAQHLAEAIDGGHLAPSDFSLKGLFQALVTNNDGTIVGNDVLEECCDPAGPRKLLAEANVDSSAFANISGQITFNAAMAAYQAEEFVFTNLIPTIQTSFRSEKLPGVSDLGDAALIVNEGKPFPVAGVNEDWVETPTTLKRGFIVPVTKEAIYFDRTGQVLRQASDLGRSFGINKEKRAIDCLVDENTTAHRYRWRGASAYTTYVSSSGHGAVNLQASNGLVDWTDIDTAEQLLANMVDPNTGEPINVMADTLVVCPQLEATAMRILDALGVAYYSTGAPTNAAFNVTNAQNPVGRNGSRYSMKYRIASSRFLPARMATDTSWFLGNPAKAFAYMQNWAATPAQAPLNSEEEFNSDIAYRFKISEMGAYATLDPRYMVKSTA